MEVHVLIKFVMKSMINTCNFSFMLDMGLDHLRVHEMKEGKQREKGLEKFMHSLKICWAKSVTKRGKKVPGQNLEIEDRKFVEDLEYDKAYKYLGIEENHTQERKLKKIYRSELSSKHKIAAINQMALPVLTFWDH